MPRLQQKPLLSLGSRQIRLRNVSINKAPRVNTGFYQTQLGKQYRGSGIFMRGGSVRTPTAMLRRRRGKGMHLRGGGMRAGSLGDSLKPKPRTGSFGDSYRAKPIRKKARTQQKRRKRGGRLYGSGGHGIWMKGDSLRMRGGGLVRGKGMGRRVQRRARVI